MGIEKHREGNSKIDEQIKKYLYNCIMYHPQVVQSPIVNDFLKVKIDGHTEPQLVPKHYFMCLSENLITNLLFPQ